MLFKVLLKLGLVALVGAKPKMCCKAMTASCLACAADMSVSEFCAKNPSTVGCPSPRACCMAMTAQCLACVDGISVD